MHTVGHDCASAMACELTIGKAQSRDRSAETDVADALEIEARLNQQAAHRSANRFAFNLKRVGGQVRKAYGTGPLKLDRAGDRAVGVHAPLSARAFEAGVVEHLADDEPTSFVSGLISPATAGNAAIRPTVKAIPRNIPRTPSTDATLPHIGPEFWPSKTMHGFRR